MSEGRGEEFLVSFPCSCRFLKKGEEGVVDITGMDEATQLESQGPDQKKQSPERSPKGLIDSIRMGGVGFL
jgi:hypothetical protein